MRVIPLSNRRRVAAQLSSLHIVINTIENYVK